MYYITHPSGLIRFLAKGTENLFFVLAVVVFTAVTANALEPKDNNLSIKSKNAASTNITESVEPISTNNNPKLLPFPSSKHVFDSENILSSRNPFAGINSQNTSFLKDLPAGIRLTGIAKVGSTKVAMVSLSNGDHAYEIGSEIGNGFIIKDISTTQQVVDVSNGIKVYRLSMSK